jgi:hypothetical protein
MTESARALGAFSQPLSLGHIFIVSFLFSVQPLRPAVLLESDLPTSLRGMGNDKPLQGNRVAEAFESLQRRNMVPVTKRMPKHKRSAVFLFVCFFLRNALMISILGLVDR